VKIVVDASVVLTWLLRAPSPVGAELAFTVLHNLRNPAAEAYMPAIGLLEVANVVARSESQSIIEAPRLEMFRAMLRVLPIRTDHDTNRLALGSVLDLARLHALSAYDAAYLELAIRLALPLASLDARVARAASGVGLLYKP